MAVTNATDLLNTTASPTESQESYLSVISLNIKRICPPILVVVGIIGNLLTLLILGKKKNRRSQSISFLLSLAVSDTLRIVTGNFSEWIRISHHGYLCCLHRGKLTYGLQRPLCARYIYNEILCRVI